MIFGRWVDYRVRLCFIQICWVASMFSLVHIQPYPLTYLKYCNAYKVLELSEFRRKKGRNNCRKWPPWRQRRLVLDILRSSSSIALEASHNRNRPVLFSYRPSLTSRRPRSGSISLFSSSEILQLKYLIRMICSEYRQQKSGFPALAGVLEMSLSTPSWKLDSVIDCLRSFSIFINN